jgi:hypothetical protein
MVLVVLLPDNTISPSNALSLDLSVFVGFDLVFQKLHN